MELWWSGKEVELKRVAVEFRADQLRCLHPRVHAQDLLVQNGAKEMWLFGARAPLAGSVRPPSSSESIVAAVCASVFTPGSWSARDGAK